VSTRHPGLLFGSTALSLESQTVKGVFMSIATLSNEGRLLDSLRQLEMNSMQFVRIGNAFNFPISSALLSLAFNGKRELTLWTAQHCLELAAELIQLKEFYKAQGINLNWGLTEADAESVATVLVRRRADLAGQEVDAAKETQ
jgi:hypothetical protein